MTAVRAPEALQFTYQDYLHLPDDGKRYQIIEGEVYMVPAPTPAHQTIQGNIYYLLRSFVAVRDLGRVFLAPCDVVLSNEDVVQPDLLFISRERSQIITERNIAGAPDLIVEILSPHTRKLDRILKRRLYARYGVQEYWLVDPATRTVEILTRKGDELVRASLLEIEDELRSPLWGEPMGSVADVFAGLEACRRE
jgi:Uma2 family endonuclease